MANETKHLFVLSFPERALAEAAVAELTELQNDEFVKVRDYAIIAKDEAGQVTVDESKEADPGGRRGGVAGGLAGAIVAIAAGPIGIGAVAVGAGIGAVTAALRDSGFKGDDLAEVGQLMEGGRAVLLFAVRPEETDRVRSSLDDLPELSAADRRWEAVVSADSKNVLRDAIAQYREQHPPTES